MLSTVMYVTATVANIMKGNYVQTMQPINIYLCIVLWPPIKTKLQLSNIHYRNINAKECDHVTSAYK